MLLCSVICGVFVAAVIIAGSSALNERELFFDGGDDPSVTNPKRPPVSDTRPSAFAMSPREALKEIDEVHTGKVDCKKMLATRGMKILRLKYKDSVYTEQASIAIRTANLVTDLMPTGSLGKMKAIDAGKVLQENDQLLYSIVRNNLESDPVIVGSAVMFYNYTFRSNYKFFAPYAYKNTSDPYIKVKDLSTSWSYLHEAFVDFTRKKALGRPFPHRTTYFSARYNQTADWPWKPVTHVFAEALDGLWTRPYYECTTTKTWVVTYTVPILGSWNKSADPTFMGVATIDIGLSKVDINQCDLGTGGNFQFEVFAGTHRCKNETTQCEPVPGLGFKVGSYRCVCRPGYYFPHTSLDVKWYNGSVLETVAADNKSDYYTDPDSYHCLPCREGCETCENDLPCIVTLNWPLRQTLLSFTVVTIAVAVGFFAFVVRYQNIKVVKTASPHFLLIILVGAVFMYCEVLVDYPSPHNHLCIVRLWLRHLGFGLLYTSLLLKTWRISVIFRVKSAQKIRLTDRHLLQRLGPILALYIVYLLAWSLAGPSQVVERLNPDHLKFYECSFDWWDHAILIFEILFLFWGIHLCYNVRKAPSAFNESKFISWSIYNMTVVTLFLKVTRLFISDVAGPDMIFLLEFFRVQLTVTLLLGLVFIPKIFRVLKGRGDVFDTSGRIASVKGAAMGVRNLETGTSAERTINLSQENDDLKEEIRKLYSQMEQMKMSHMEAGNRHLSRSTSLVFASTNSLAKDVNTAGGMNKTTKGRRPQRLSPGTELVSDFV